MPILYLYLRSFIDFKYLMKAHEHIRVFLLDIYYLKINKIKSKGRESNLKKVSKAIIPAAGLGTRFLPATKAMPKEMLPIVDKPTIQYIIEEAVASGIEDIIIVTGKGKRSIEDHFDNALELEQNLLEKGKARFARKSTVLF